MTFVHDRVVDEAGRWLHAGHDVLLRGDTGSGRTTVLHALAERRRVAGATVVLLTGTSAGRAIALSAVYAHPVLPTRGSLPEAFASLTEALDTRTGVVLLDDIHLLDDATLAVVGGVVANRRGLVRVVATVPDGTMLRPSVAALLRGATTIALPPLDFNHIATLLAHRLGAQVEGGLTSVVAGRSGGNARVALALVAAGERAGVVERIDGRWALTGSLSEGSGAGVVHALTADLPEHARRGLEVVAWFGVVDLAHARELLGDETVETLAAAGRLVVHERERVDVVSVGPPALAQALRQAITPIRASTLRARAAALVDLPAPAQEPRPDPDGVSALVASPADPAARRAAVGEAVTVLIESVRAQAALRLDSWTRNPVVAHALPLLRLRLLENVTSVDIDDIVARTVPGPGDDPHVIGSYALLRAQWAAACGRPARDALTHDPGPSGRLVVADASEPFLALLDHVYADVPRPGAPPLDDADVPVSLADFVMILRVQDAIEAGAPDRALDLLGAWPGAVSQRPLTDQLDALRGDALALVGQVPDAIAWARGRRSEAYDRLSEFGVRLASRGLATALFLHGDEGGARAALSVVLRLGRCGPVQSPYDERIYGLAAVLHARRGEHDVAHAMLDELDATPRPYVPALDVMRPWARSEVETAATGEPAGGEALWDAGEEHADAGRLASAALCWSLAPLRLDPLRLARLEELYDATHLPILGPAVRLHRQLARGHGDALVSAAEALRTRGPRALVAVRAAQERDRADGGAALSPADVARLVGAPVTTRPDGAELTPREAEIAALARDGLANREIASRLFLSVRTVESHLYRAMQKLGASDRHQLVSLPSDLFPPG